MTPTRPRTKVPVVCLRRRAGSGGRGDPGLRGAEPRGRGNAHHPRPAATSHAGMGLQDRDRLGITADLIRISSGIEGTQDLVGDFARALDKASV